MLQRQVLSDIESYKYDDVVNTTLAVVVGGRCGLMLPDLLLF